MLQSCTKLKKICAVGNAIAGIFAEIKKVTCESVSTQILAEFCSFIFLLKG